jgi:hypothetical protein
MDKKYGKVVKIMVLSLICGMLLSSCTFGSSLIKVEDDGAVAEKKCKQILSAIEQKDKEKLKSLFSNKALREAKNIDQNMEYSFAQFHGEVEKWTQLGPGVEEDIEYGDRRKKIIARFIIETNQEKYLLFFYDYPVDDFDSSNIGIYTLCLMKKADWDKKIEEAGSWSFLKEAGVYKPEE